MIAELLHWLGLSGSVVSAIVVFYVLYHLRDVVKIVSYFGMLAWVATVGIGVFLAIAIAMPGMSISVQIGVVIDVIVALIQGGLDIAMKLVDLLSGVLG